MAEPLKVMFFCLGNICRSPLAEGLFRHKVEQRGLTDRFHIESAGTSSYHVGEFDVLVAMDEANRRGALGFGLDKPIHLLRQWERDPGDRELGVPDPWGGGRSQFDLVFDICDQCCEALLNELEAQL